MKKKKKKGLTFRVQVSHQIVEDVEWCARSILSVIQIENTNIEYKGVDQGHIILGLMNKYILWRVEQSRGEILQKVPRVSIVHEESI